MSCYLLNFDRVITDSVKAVARKINISLRKRTCVSEQLSFILTLCERYLTGTLNDIKKSTLKVINNYPPYF